MQFSWTDRTIWPEENCSPSTKIIRQTQYDPLGRPTRSRQITGTTTYRFGTDTSPGYEYLLNGSLSVQRYPSGRELQTGYDDLARPISVNGLMNGTPSQYLKSATYTAHGAPDVMRLNGDSLRERYGYDANRLQLTSIDVESCNGTTCSTPSELLHLDFNYGTANNNGNLRDQTIRGSGLNLKQTYSYDSISRLSGFTEGPVGGANAIQETYCFDRHGNRAVLTRPGLSSITPQVTACNEQDVLNLFPKNQIAGSVYDAGGQLKSDGRSELRFDIEERLRRTEPISGAATVYEYDGDGRRVSKQTGTATPVIFVYDAMGQLAAEYGNFAEATGLTYLHTDHLGSTRLVTDGTTSVKRMDYFPFGGELTAGDTAYRTTGALFTSGLTPTQKFTGKERDAETGLDYFGARYMSGAQGRFLAADPSPQGISLGDPQSWNLYAYTRNRPLSNVDINGNWTQSVHHDIVRFSLAGLLSAGEIQVLVNRQISMDRDQSTGGSHKHAMGEPGEAPQVTLNRMWGFVSENIDYARSSSKSNGSLTPGGLASLGDAMHTLQDFTSLQHVSSSGVPIVFNGVLGDNVLLIPHVLNEDQASDNWAGFGRAIRLTLAAFMQASPDQAARGGLTAETIDKIADKRINQYVQHFYNSLTPLSSRTRGSGTSEVEREAARQCALGNPAACR